MRLIKRLVGDLDYWTSTAPLQAWGWLRLLVLATGLGLTAYSKLLQSSHQFVGNDTDLPLQWMWQLRFTRLWQNSGVTPWWNPFGVLGHSNEQGASHPYSLLNSMQRLFPLTEKGLDYTLVFLAMILILSSCVFLTRLRFSPLAALLGGLLFGCTGMVVTQLFAGHLPVYACFCLTSAFALSLFEGLRRSQIWALTPAALLVAGLLMSGDWQAAYLVLWTVGGFFLMRAALGSPEAIPSPTIWTRSLGESRPGALISLVRPRIRGLETLWTLLKLMIVILMGGLLSACVWLPTLALSTAAPEFEVAYPFSAPPIAWLNLLIPHFFLGDGQYYSWTGWPQWEGQPGMGVASLLILLLGVGLRRCRGLLLPLLLLAVASLLAAGKFTPAFKIYSFIDPCAQALEVPSRFFFTINFAYMLLFAWGIDSLSLVAWELPSAWNSHLRRGLAGLLLFWLVTFYLDGSGEVWQLFLSHLQNGYNYGGLQPVNAQDYYTLTWLRYSAVCLMIGSIVYCLLRQPQQRRPWLVSGLLLLDITRFVHPYANLRANLEFQLPGSAYAIMQEHQLQGRVSNTYQPNIRGAFSLLRQSEWDAPWKVNEDWENFGRLAQKILGQQASFGFPTTLSRFFGVNLFYYSQGWLDSEFRTAFVDTTNYLSQSESQGNWAFALDPRARPLAYVSRAPEIATPRQMLEVLHKHPEKLAENTTFVGPKTYQDILEQLKQGSWTRRAFPDRITISQEEPNRTELGCVLSAPALVILNQIWTPDWTASVDGVDVPCWPCQCGFNRGVLVDAGEHQVLFQYNPKLPQKALRLSWVSWVIMTLSLAAMLFLSYFQNWMKASRE